MRHIVLGHGIDTPRRELRHDQAGAHLAVMCCGASLELGPHMLGQEAGDSVLNLDDPLPTVALGGRVLTLTLQAAQALGFRASLIGRQVRLTANTDPPHPPLEP